MVPQRPAARAFLVTILDAALIVAASAAVVILLGGRTRVDVAGLSVSVRAPGNALLFAMVCLAGRLLCGRLMPFLPAVVGRSQASLERERDRIARPPPRGRVYWAHAAAAALASLVWLLPHVAHPRRVPDVGDPVFSAWRIARVAHQLAYDPLHPFDGNIFHPTPNTLAYSDATILQGLAGAPFVLAGADPLVVSNAILLLGFPLVALAFYHLGWRLTHDPRAAFLTAMLGALAATRHEQYSHVEMQLTPFIPLAVVALLDLVVAPTRRRGVRLGALVAGQWLAGMYLGLMLLLWLVPFGAAVAVAWARRPLRPLLGAAAISWGIIAVGFGAVAWPYFDAHRAHGAWTAATIEAFSAEGPDYRQPSPRVWRFSASDAARGPDERRLFPGWLTLGLAAGALIPPVGAAGAGVTMAGALAFDWSLGPHGLTYDELQTMPGVTGVRAPARFSVLVTTSLVILAAAGAARLLRAADAHRLGAAAMAVLTSAGLLIDLRPSIQLTDFWKTTPSIYANVDRSMVLAEFPFGKDNDIAYMYFSTRHWGRLLNGYSGFFPRSYVELRQRVASFPSSEAIDLVRAAGATHLTFNCALEPRKWRCKPTIALLDTNPALELVAGELWENEDVRLYRFK